MEYIKVIIADWLPCTIRGFTAYYYDIDGQVYYTIFINAHLNHEMQCATYDHEIKHIDGHDFDHMFPIEDLEAMRHAV